MTVAKSYPLFVLPLSHFDLVWRRPVRWYRQRRAAVFHAALDLLDELPEFRYSFCQADAVRQFLDDYPQVRGRFLRMLKAGRLEIQGGPMSIPDLNLSSGEALVRNQMAGKRYFQSLAGLNIQIANFEDSFGVPVSLPQILRLCGMRFFRASRMPAPGKPDITGPFIWAGLDGSRMFSCAAIGCSWGFGTSPNVDDPPNDYNGRRRQFQSEFKALRLPADAPALWLFIGEEHIPKRDYVSAFQEAAHTAGITFRWTTMAEFETALTDSGTAARAPVKKGDYSRIFTGCYTTRPEQKQMVSELEGLLLSRVNYQATVGNPPVGPDDAWEHLFLAQFHDAAGGCHIAENARFIERALRAARKQILVETRGPAMFNPLLAGRKAPFLWPRGRQGSGEEIDVQSLDNDWICNVPFDPLEIRKIRPRPKASVTRTSRGNLVGVRDRTILIPEGRRAGLIVDGRRWRLPGLLRLREDVGTLWTEEYTGRVWSETGKDARPELLEDGPLFCRAVWSGDMPFCRDLWPGFTRLTWRRHLLLFHAEPWIWLRIEIVWSGNSTEVAWSLLSAETEAQPIVTGAIPFGSLRRRHIPPGADWFTGDVFPSPNWLDAEFGGGGWMIARIGVPACRIVAGGIENILLRSPIKRWAPLFPVQPDPTAWANGRHRIDILLTPRQDRNPAQAEWLGMAMQQPPLPVADFRVHGNRIGLPRSLP
ncbi:MAG: hypothetical protein Q7J98_12780, partial [Kiritimatiellia bacterium]|nr:hypothetical protein [Kiritimatiellia bacterium]